MDSAIYTIDPGSDPTEEEVDQMLEIYSPVWCDQCDMQITCAETEREMERRLARELSAPRPYHYRGRTNKCFFKTRKTRWRKG